MTDASKPRNIVSLQPVDPRVSLIHRAWAAGRVAIVTHLQGNLGGTARWAVPSRLHVVAPVRQDPPADPGIPEILFTRERDEVWGSLAGMRLRLAKDVDWSPA